MNSQDVLFAVEEQALFLQNSVVLLRLLTDGLSKGLISCQGELRNNCADWVLEWCNGFFVLLRDLERISGDLDEAVSKGFEGLKNTVETGEIGR